jgi:cell wall-associated NlpC family hydrolase
LIKISKDSLIDSNEYFGINEILQYISRLEGIPYLWGGKSSFGYDCSGLIQIIAFMSNYNLPRDCSMQIKSKQLSPVKSSDISMGDLVYFSFSGNVDHVGIFLNEIDFIHSSGCVKINSTSKESDIYDSKLCDNIYDYYRFKQ